MWTREAPVTAILWPAAAEGDMSTWCTGLLSHTVTGYCGKKERLGQDVGPRFNRIQKLSLKYLYCQLQKCLKNCLKHRYDKKR